MPKAIELPPSLAPRGLRRPIAAAYLGVSSSKFDELRRDKLVPLPKKLGGVEVWCRYELDEIFSALPTEAANDNDWDGV